MRLRLLADLLAVLVKRLLGFRAVPCLYLLLMVPLGTFVGGCYIAQPQRLGLEVGHRLVDWALHAP